MGLFGKKNTDDVKKDEKDLKAKSASSDKKDNSSDTKTKKVVKKDKKNNSEKNIAPRAYKVLLKPVISEKATIGVSLNKYVFEVAREANKIEVKKAIEEIYNVIPQSVNIINAKGKNVRFGRNKGKQKDTKKAIVTLRKGDTIKLYEGI